MRVLVPLGFMVLAGFVFWVWVNYQLKKKGKR